MKRIVLVLTIALVMVAMLLATAGSAMAKSTNHTENAKPKHTAHHALKGDNHSLKDADLCQVC